VKEVAMLFEYVLGGAVTTGILVYLTYALLRPEKL
jgi:K+-transporting ATPase KdpF subunit